MQISQTGSGSFHGPADKLYEEIRRNINDVKAISKVTGIKEENILKVKKHLFYDSYLLDRYVDHGIPAEMKRFDSDLAIANAWKRLEQGSFKPEDIQLLKHETAEAWYMKRCGPSYTIAHNAASLRFPAPDLEEVFDQIEALQFNNRR